jgi:thioredoxin-like negative regulator of GroEL
MEVQLVLHYFTASSCGVCHSLRPKIEELNLRKFPQIPLELHDVEEQPRVAAEFGVFTVPVLILTVDGKESHRWVRNFGLMEMEQKLSRLITLIA